MKDQGAMVLTSVVYCILVVALVSIFLSANRLDGSVKRLSETIDGDAHDLELLLALVARCHRPHWLDPSGLGPLARVADDGTIVLSFFDGVPQTQLRFTPTGNGTELGWPNGTVHFPDPWKFELLRGPSTLGLVVSWNGHRVTLDL